MTANLECLSFEVFCERHEKNEIGIAWSEFLEHIELYFGAVPITELAQQISILRFKGGPEIKKAIPATVTRTDTWKVHTEAITKHFVPVYTQIFCAYKMMNLKQGDDEMVDSFVERLMKVAKSCNFSSDETEKEVLRCLTHNSNNPKTPSYILSLTAPKLDAVLIKIRTYENVAN